MPLGGEAVMSPQRDGVDVMLRTVSEQSGLVTILTMPIAIRASRRIYNPPVGMVREAGLLAQTVPS